MHMVSLSVFRCFQFQFVFKLRRNENLVYSIVLSKTKNLKTAFQDFKHFLNFFSCGIKDVVIQLPAAYISLIISSVVLFWPKTM